MSQFDIVNKIALVTGGASGLGLQCAIKLLEEGARGVTLADINKVAGTKAVRDIEEKFGPNKAIFVYCNIQHKSDFENAFIKTIESFQNIDVLINNAGIFDDRCYEKEIGVNVIGVAHGMVLGVDKYIPKYRSGSEGLIVNVSSIAGINSFPFIPIYTGTKFAIHGMTLAWGDVFHYSRTKVRVVGVCPGATETPLLRNFAGLTLGPDYEAYMVEGLKLCPSQTPEQMANRTMEIIKKAPSGTMWVVEANMEPWKFELPNYQNIEKVSLDQVQ
ncbi:15-hydroxyprostaglandin dehydrogenase [NAD(+)]-like [Rhynchophorus ferrugineus]|uniref:15-hydroxyprostaglandin dehydrogenase [NAD(+)]-like n=1 Tax=Rhynchophorus ferrugineus TaxID=354439 RepID=UPI003FCE3B06